MKLALILVTLKLTAALVSSYDDDSAVDEVFIKRQLLVLRFMEHVHEPISPLNEHLMQIKTAFNPLENIDLYKDTAQVLSLVLLVNNGESLGRDEIFSSYHPAHLREATHLFEVLQGAVDWDAFFNMAVCLRDKMNARLVLYAFSVAFLHRGDCRGIALPAPYEVIPEMFIPSDVIRKGYQAKMTNTSTLIPMKNQVSPENEEKRVVFFTEDVGINAFHMFWNMEFTPWWKRNYHPQKDRVGELFFYTHHQLVNRYNAERQAHGLSQVEPLDWAREITEGFAPGLGFINGQQLPARPDRLRFQDLPGLPLSDITDSEERVRDAIDAGFVTKTDGSIVFLNDSQGINTLGRIIYSFDHDFNPDFFGRLYNNAQVLLGKVIDPSGRLKLPPSAVVLTETAARDPAFYRFHKHINTLFKRHKDLLPPYTRDQLQFPEVTLEEVSIIGETKGSVANQIFTTFDKTHVDLDNLWSQGLEETIIKAKVKRLNYESFKYTLVATAERDVNVVVRVFLRPSRDRQGCKIGLDEGRWGAIEMDRFPVKLTQGQSVIARNSEDSTVTIPELRTFPDLYKDMELAALGDDEYAVDMSVRHCGFPQRLLVPTGTSEGMDFELMVVITDFDKDIVVLDMGVDDMDNLPSMGYCGVLDGRIPDGKPMGYPFDRRIRSEEEFKTKNMKFVNIRITNVKPKF